MDNDGRVPSVWTIGIVITFAVPHRPSQAGLSKDCNRPHSRC